MRYAVELVYLVTKVNSNINKLPITDLVRNKFLPRKNFDKESLEDLTNSIKERGVIQPIIVRKSVIEMEAQFLALIITRRRNIPPLKNFRRLLRFFSTVGKVL